MAFNLTFDAGAWRVVIDDDDRTCYAYLIRGEQTVADVWLCNRTVDLTSAPDWESPNAIDLMPFRNPTPYVSTGRGDRWSIDNAAIGIHPAGRESLAKAVVS